MSKPARSFPRPLSEFLGATLGGVMKAQGFASTEIISRWADIVGPEIAAHSEPMKINWPRVKNDAGDGDQAEPATLVLRVEGPAALEIQHQSAIIVERVNRFFGWQAIGRLALRQAPLRRRTPALPPPAPDPAVTARIAEGMPQIEDEDLRQALARLGAAVKRK
ncbi:MAG TPA: DciA family protein [Pseudolabrys sp.]|nr:DciA family protein [Pseudolabrys sp.]